MTTDEAHAKEILDHIEQTRLYIDNFSRQGSHPCAENKCIFVTFWDFDGTIIHGDITDGLQDSESGAVVYKGLQQLAIEAGIAPAYLGEDGFARYRADYERRERTAGHAEAYAYIAQVFAGARPAEFEALVREHFESRLTDYYYRSSLDMIRVLQHNGVQTHVVSASPSFFVKGAAASLDIPDEWITGVELELDGEFLSDRIKAPFNYGPGKTERVQRVLADIREREETEHVYVLAGFGNSYHTDGHFLDWISSQELPDGEPLAVLINGDAPEPDPDWRHVEQSSIVGE